MSAEQKETEQNALATTLTDGWTNFKQGRLISYRLMALLLILCVALGVWWYISAERGKNTSKQWLAFDEARSVDALDKFEKQYPNTPAGKVAEVVIARSTLGTDGIDMLNSPKAETRQKAVENIETARKEFERLLPLFEKDPVFKAECLLGLAKAEAALVGVPVKTDAPTGPNPVAPTRDARGKVETVIKYLDELAAVAAPDTPWATESKKLADTLRANPSKFVDVQQALTTQEPRLPDADPHGLGGLPPGLPRPPGLPK